MHLLFYVRSLSPLFMDMVCMQRGSVQLENYGRMEKYTGEKGSCFTSDTEGMERDFGLGTLATFSFGLLSRRKNKDGAKDRAKEAASAGMLKHCEVQSQDNVQSLRFYSWDF